MASAIVPPMRLRWGQSGDQPQVTLATAIGKGPPMLALLCTSRHGIHAKSWWETELPERALPFGAFLSRRPRGGWSARPR